MGAGGVLSSGCSVVSPAAQAGEWPTKVPERGWSVYLPSVPLPSRERLCGVHVRTGAPECIDE